LASSFLTDEEKPVLLALANEALAAHLHGRRATPPGDRGRTPRLLAPGAAFVTLRTKDGDLRGCIGTTRFERPLREVVGTLAVSAATEDHRFPAVTRDELPGIELSISVLTPLEVANTDAIEIGRHGLVVRAAGRSGLLLPQVASERGWTARTFLAQTCQKAGLPPDAWSWPNAEVLWFTAENVGKN
jgi:AmmeMemoRadiSam system protein A